jgi:hypothetical protein
MSIYKDIVEGYQLNNIQEKDKLNNVLVQLNEKDDQEMIWKIKSYFFISCSHHNNWNRNHFYII